MSSNLKKVRMPPLACGMLAVSALIVMAALPAFAQPAAAPARPNALVEFPAKGGAKLTVTTPAWQDGGDIPYENTQYRGNVFPGLAWTRGPGGTKSYVVIMRVPLKEKRIKPALGSGFQPQENRALGRPAMQS